LHKLANKEYRKIAQTIFSKLNPIYESHMERKLRLSDLDDIAKFLRGHSKETEKAVKSLLRDELSISSMGISCIGLLSLSIDPSENADELFPHDWLFPSKVNPNFVLSHMLNHLANYGLAVQVLIEKGLDAQARSQLRLLIELSWLILALVYDQELWANYVATDEKNEGKFWSKNLKSYQLNKKLSEIEDNIGMDEELLKILQSTRKESYAAYSNVVHHSYTSVMLGSMAFSESDGNIIFGVFGEVNNASKATVNQLNYVLWYFSLSFFSILEKVHRVSPKTPKKDFWLEAFALSFCLKEIYLFAKV